MTWNMIICEGAHDQEFLASVLLASGEWHHASRRPTAVPQSLPPTAAEYTYLTWNNVAVAISGTGGATKLLGTKGLELAKSAKTAHTVAIIIDADELGVNARRDAVRAQFTPAIPSAARAEPGEFSVADSTEQIRTRCGLWVAPNCIANGSLDALIRRAVSTLHPRLESLATSYVSAVRDTMPHVFGQYFDKAIAGAAGQRWKAGASLASSLQERDQWVTPSLLGEEWLSPLSTFLTRAAKGL